MISDDELYIEDGENLTKNELKSRLHQMELEYDNSNQRKKYFVDLYNKAIKYFNNRKKIKERLERDTLEHLERRNKRIRETSEDASKILNLKGRSSKIDNKDSKNIENKIETDINVKIGPSKSFAIVKEKPNSQEIGKKFVMEEEKNIEERNLINYAELIPNKEKIVTTKSVENLSKVRKSEPPAELDNIPITNRKFGVTNAKIVVTKISGAKLISPSISTDKRKTSPVFEFHKSQNLQNFKQVATQDFSDVTFEDINKQYLFSGKNEIISDNKLNNDQILGRKSIVENLSGKCLETEIPIIYPNKRRTSFPTGISNINQIKLQSTANIIENYSKTPTPTESKKRITTNQAAIEQIEGAQNLKYVFPFQKETFIETDINKRINGGIPQSPRIIVSSIKTIPLVTHENGMELKTSWTDIGPSGTSLKQLIKYFLAGMACSIIFSGIYYIIKFSPSIIAKFGQTRTPREDKLIFNVDSSDNVKWSESSKSINFGGIPNPTKIPESTYIGTETGSGYFETLNDRFYDFFRPFGRIFEFILNPKKILYELLIDGLKYVAVDLTWGWIRNNIWMFTLLLALKLIMIKTYHYVMNRRNSNKIFISVKNRLKNIYDVNNLQNGISEDEIIREYSKEYNIKEDNFKNTILPRLKDLRKHDGEVKEFENYVNGRVRTVWQYLGY